MRVCGAIASLALAAMTVAGCSGFGGPKPAQPAQAAPPPDPNAYPSNYRNQIAGYLATELQERVDFTTALIAPPAVKPVGQSQRYVVCLRFPARNPPKDKVVVYLFGSLQQYVDPTPEQCADAPFQPFTELALVKPK